MILNKPSPEDETENETDDLCDLVEHLTEDTGLDFYIDKERPLVEYNNRRWDLYATSLGADKKGEKWGILLSWEKDQATPHYAPASEVKILDREKIRAEYEHARQRIRNCIGSIFILIGLAVGTHKASNEIGKMFAQKNENTGLENHPRMHAPQ